jgi:hypothetical protein
MTITISMSVKPRIALGKVQRWNGGCMAVSYQQRDAAAVLLPAWLMVNAPQRSPACDAIGVAVTV